MSDQPLIQHISDTARWAAVYRAAEAERPDALFHDRFARRLAGDRGLQIAAALPFHQQHAWSWVARTYAFDRLIAGQLKEGVDMVVNLAGGLDMRPYRMELPKTLNWIEVDLPGILNYKEEIIGPVEKPSCAVERVRMDLGDVDARRRLLKTLADRSKKALVLTEGLVIYLSGSEVGALAKDLFDAGVFQSWIVDLVSPGLLQMLLENTSVQFGEGVATLKFAPTNGPDFFKPYGWDTVSVDSMGKVAVTLKRLPSALEAMVEMEGNPNEMGPIPWSGVCLLERVSG